MFDPTFNEGQTENKGGLNELLDLSVELNYQLRQIEDLSVEIDYQLRFIDALISHIAHLVGVSQD